MEDKSWVECARIDECVYPAKKGGGLAFTAKFYELGLIEKYIILGRMQFEGLLDHPQTLVRAADAILRHSSKKIRNAYPCKRVWKLASAARQKDNAYGWPMHEEIE